MNEKENDPRTSFQEGAPIPASESIRLDAEQSIAVAPSKLDQIAAAIKGYERWGLVLGVGVQLLVLLGMIVMGAMRGGF
jgi:hypothetical protein